MDEFWNSLQSVGLLFAIAALLGAVALVALPTLADFLGKTLLIIVVYVVTCLCTGMAWFFWSPKGQPEAASEAFGAAIVIPIVCFLIGFLLKKKEL